MESSSQGESCAQLLTSRQVADLLQISESTLRTWRYERRGPPWGYLGERVVKPRVRYRLSDVLEWIDTNWSGGHDGVD